MHQPHTQHQDFPSRVGARTPLLFLGHGSPMNAIEENRFVDGFRTIARQLDKPAAIVCVSAHWYTRGTFITHQAHPRTIHDMYGFPPPLYEVQYPAPGYPALAERVQALLGPFGATLDTSWGLDHGTWSVLRHLFPAADVPVIQLSLDGTRPATEHYEMAKRLAPIREEGVLVVGSGNLVHNLRMVDGARMDEPDYGYPWARQASDHIRACLLDKDVRTLLDTGHFPDYLSLAVPTPDHYLPLAYVLGLWQPDEALTLFNDELVGGSISMTSLLIR